MSQIRHLQFRCNACQAGHQPRSVAPKSLKGEWVGPNGVRVDPRVVVKAQQQARPAAVERHLLKDCPDVPAELLDAADLGQGRK